MSFNQYPDNPNFLSPVGFRFTIKRLPHVSFFAQQATIPNVNLGTATVPTPFSNIPVPGDHLNYGTFDLTFKLDEQLKNYTEVYNWMVALGFPDSFEQSRAVVPRMNTLNEGLYSDGVLEILNSAKRSVVEVRFVDTYPTSLSSVMFNSQDTSINYLEATMSLTFRTFQIVPVN